MNLSQKIKLLITLNKFVKENKMLQSAIGWLDGRKTYLFTIGWGVYKIGISQAWWPENHQIETILLGGGALSLREAVGKIEKK